MTVNFFRNIILFLLLLNAFTLRAGIPSIPTTAEACFNEKEIKKKGIYLSEIFSDAEINKKARLKFSGAMRFDAGYAPQNEKPVNLPFSEIKRHVDRAHAVLKTIQESEAYTTLLEGKNIELPIGIKKNIGNKQVVICIDSLVFTPTHAYGVLYAIIEDTKNNKKLAFWAKDIRFTRDGGFTGDARLELLETYDLKFGEKSKISFLVDHSHENYLIFDCNGFKHLHVDAKIFFSRDNMVPELPNGTIAPAPAQVTAEFETDFVSFDDWFVQISNVPKFQVVGLEGLSFEVGTLAFDYSSLENPTGISFPAGYDHPSFSSGDRNLWEGFYIKNLSVTLPEEFKLKSDNTKRIKLSIEHAIIDKLGFTGRASVTDALPLNEGDMSGWNYSVDYISVDVLKNTPVAASFRGQLIVPITKEDEKFAYNANILPKNNYNFTLTVKSTLNFPLWGAGNVQINPDSWIKIALVSKKFVPEASLTGKFNLTCTVNGKNGDNNTSDKNSNLSLAEISFTKLILKTTKAYISIDPNGGAVSFGSPLMEQKMAKLPISITKVGMESRSGGDQLGIRFTIKVNLTGEKDSGGGFSGSADITIWGEQKAGTTKWAYYKTELNRIELNNIQIAVLTLSGYIEFYREDPVYGSGFSGGIDIKIDCGAGFGVKAKCIFGKKDIVSKPGEVYRYWAVDMLASIPATPLFPGIVYLNAIGGGASYRMRMDNTVQNAKFVSLSNVVYVPDDTKGLGLKALIGIQGQTRKAYEGQLIFEIEFNAGGGLSQIAFSGYVQIASLGNFDQLNKLKSSMGGFVSKVKATGGSVTSSQASGSEVYGEIQKMGEGGALLAQWRMVYDNNNKSFMANLDLFIDVAGVLKGVNANSHAGRIDILFNKKEWHVFVGLPNYPVGVNLISLFDITGYFMVGMNLPPPKKMPVPGAPTPSFPTNAAGQASIGKGFGTGARLHIGIDKGGTFYYRAGLDAGFDILIWSVAGEMCSGRPKGVKGWYGTGQAFVYAYGSAGLETCSNIPYPCNCGWGCCFKVWKKRICPCPVCDWCHKKVCINVSANIDLGLSAYVEAPNPTYFEGTFYILGMSVNVKGGKRC